jgi:hypothetical protein
MTGLRFRVTLRRMDLAAESLSHPGAAGRKDRNVMLSAETLDLLRMVEGAPIIVMMPERRWSWRIDFSDLPKLAVTIGLWAGGRFKTADVMPYIIAQVRAEQLKEFRLKWPEEPVWLRNSHHRRLL